MVNYTGDLLFGCEATWLSELLWNCKTVGGKLLICTSTSEKNVSLKSFQARQQSSVLSGSWILLKTMYSLWESQLVVGGRVGMLGEGFQARAHAARALKVLLVIRWRYVCDSESEADVGYKLYTRHPNNNVVFALVVLGSWFQMRYLLG